MVGRLMSNDVGRMWEGRDMSCCPECIWNGRRKTAKRNSVMRNGLRLNIYTQDLLLRRVVWRSLCLEYRYYQSTVFCTIHLLLIWRATIILHKVLHSSLLSSYDNPSVHFIHQGAAIWLSYDVLHARCSAISSASAHISWYNESPHCKTVSNKTSFLADNTQACNNYCRGNKSVRVRTSQRTQRETGCQDG
jgi:hypothetical protein